MIMIRAIFVSVLFVLAITAVVGPTVPPGNITKTCLCNKLQKVTSFR